MRKTKHVNLVLRTIYTERQQVASKYRSEFKNRTEQTVLTGSYSRKRCTRFRVIQTDARPPRLEEALEP